MTWYMSVMFYLCTDDRGVTWCITVMFYLCTCGRRDDFVYHFFVLPVYTVQLVGGMTFLFHYYVFTCIQVVGGMTWYITIMFYLYTGGKRDDLVYYCNVLPDSVYIW